MSGLGDPTTRGSSYRSPTRFDYAVPYNATNRGSEKEEERKTWKSQKRAAEVAAEDSDEDCEAIPFIKFVPESGKFELD